MTNPFSSENLSWEKRTQGFQKLFREYLFVFVEYLFNRSLKIRTEHFKN